MRPTVARHRQRPQALGNPNGPAAAFAQGFLDSVMSGLPMPQAQSDGPKLRHKMLPCASSARAKCARAPRNASCAAIDKASCGTNCCRGRRRHAGELGAAARSSNSLAWADKS